MEEIVFPYISLSYISGKGVSLLKKNPIKTVSVVFFFISEINTETVIPVMLFCPLSPFSLFSQF